MVAVVAESTSAGVLLVSLAITVKLAATSHPAAHVPRLVDMADVQRTTLVSVMPVGSADIATKDIPTRENIMTPTLQSRVQKWIWKRGGFGTEFNSGIRGIYSEQLEIVFFLLHSLF
uniref:Secreted protein n=1 Tax=Homalodisca liturata TaxID=320908 RepID=A0A1B6JHM0_9HEMI